jgi:hypothetical protein
VVTAGDLVIRARSYVGTPWKHRGRGREGLDCAGLLIAVASDLGLDHPGKLTYERMPSVELIDSLLKEYATKTNVWALGCFARIAVAKRWQHLGIIATSESGEFTLIHAYYTVGRVCEHRIDARWKRRIVDVWQMKGIA